MRLRYFLLPMLFILSIFLGKKPAHLSLGENVRTGSENEKHAADPPLILYTSLSDSLPYKELAKLDLQDVGGIKIRYPAGHFASYFEYEADASSLLNLVASAPFNRHALLADATCRKISYRDFQTWKMIIPPAELEQAASFWTEDGKDFDIYECIKPPFKHTILIANHSKHVLHRVEGV